MNPLPALMDKLNSKTLNGFFVITTVYVALYEFDIVLPAEFVAAAILGISFKEGMAKRWSGACQYKPSPGNASEKL